jgi:hypothetical protein
MLRLETISYLLASLLLAWGGGWLFTRDYELGLILCCALWAASTVWLLMKAARILLRQGKSSNGAPDGGGE